MQFHKKYYSHLLVYICLASILSACANKPPKVESQLINGTALKSQLDEQKPLKIIDVRTPAEFAQGAIPGAINIDVHSEDFDEKISALAKDSPYVVYCAKGIRSAAAIERMKKAGFTNLADLEGGLNTWKKEFDLE